MRYSAGGRSAATAATGNHAGAALWNASTTKPILLREVWWFKTVATVDNQALARITTRGTPGTTETPDADNCWDVNKVTPQSGALVDLAAYSAQPTVAGAPFYARANLPAAIGSGFIWVFNEPLWIPQTNGVAIITPPAVILQPADVTFVWEE